MTRATMIASLILLAASMTVAPQALADGDHPHAEQARTLAGFQDLAWGDSPDAVERKLKGRFAVAAVSVHGQVVYAGSFGGFAGCQVITDYVDFKQLFSTRVKVPLQPNQAITDTFNQALGNLTAKYGAPSYTAFVAIADRDDAIVITRENVDDTLLLARGFQDVLDGKRFINAEWPFAGKCFITLMTLPPAAGRRPEFLAIDYYNEALGGKVGASDY